MAQKTFMRKVSKWSGELAIMLAIIIAISAWQSRHLLGEDEQVNVTRTQLASLEGETLPMFTKGERTLVYFFAPWCTVCAFSIGSLDALPEDKIRVVRVALDYRDSNEVMRFVDDNDVHGDILLGTEVLKQQFNIRGYPTYYLLDEQGRVQSAGQGYRPSLVLRLSERLNRS